MTAELTANVSGQTESTSKAPPRGIPLRLWIMAAILATFWIFELSVYSTEMSMFPRFISRMLVYLLLLVVFLGWWLSNRHLLWRDRLLGLGLLFGGAALTLLVADRSTRMLVVMAGFPRLFTAWTLWLLVTNNRSLNVRRAGFCVATVLVLGYFTLVRFDGLDGAQRGKLSWRWSPTPEQVFLTTAAKRGDQPAGRWELRAGDWPDFFSDQREGGIPGISISENWSAQPPQPVWRHRVGPAWSSMIVVDGHLVTQEQRGASEAVVCYSAATGDEHWAHEESGRFEEPLAGAGPRATPAFADGRVYALGAKGKLTCLNATTGQTVWSRDSLDEASADVPQWGLSASPLIVDDKVIVFAGGKSGRSLKAYRAASGESVWTNSAGHLSYSSPQLVTLAGQRQILMHDDAGLHAVNAESGETLWTSAGSSAGAMPMLQPHVVGENQLLIAAGAGVALLDVKHEAGQWSVSQRWESSALKPGFNDFVVHENHIFGLDDGILCCLDLPAGRRVWKKGRYGHGQLLLLASPAQLVVVAESGEVAAVAANPKQFEELGRFQAVEGKTWNHPTIAHGCLFVRNGIEMACYRLTASGQ
jgi:outer membrane protein assembly factor BamB